MDFAKSVSSQKRRNKLKLKDTFEYPHDLQFYNNPPTENISLQEFEAYALERLKVLKAVETVGIRHVKASDDYKDALTKELKNLSKNQYIKFFSRKSKNQPEQKTEDIENRKKDLISHFILRLAYCRSEDLRRWFIAQELDLFRFRFMQEDDDSLQEFLHLNKLNYEPIPKEEKQSISNELVQAAGNNSVPVDITNYYKVPFTDAIDLVKSRKVFLSEGFAYVPHNELVVIILSAFRVHLSHALAITSRALPQLEEDDRLLPMLSHMSKRYLGQDYTDKKPSAGVITSDMIDALSKKSFPLCMANLQKHLKDEGHLRHVGRMQYGLFLKGIGLSLEEAMKFWRASFAKTTDSEKFDKNYSYGIRHNYGKEGKRANYTPYSCVKIITTNHPSHGEHHGCPFRHTDVDLLKQRLHSFNINNEGVNEVIDSVKGANYQIACARYFELVHNVDKGTFNVNHPNQYFEESQKIINPQSASQEISQASSGEKMSSKDASKSDMRHELSEMEQASLFDDDMTE